MLLLGCWRWRTTPAPWAEWGGGDSKQNNHALFPEVNEGAVGLETQL